MQDHTNREIKQEENEEESIAQIEQSNKKNDDHRYWFVLIWLSVTNKPKSIFTVCIK